MAVTRGTLRFRGTPVLKQSSESDDYAIKAYCNRPCTKSRDILLDHSTLCIRVMGVAKWGQWPPNF